ncbi:hypothetical protein NQ318_011664 [Aromia moschata]|uniref:Uncharacterized protein n=1 Tax=Aromia moschata TaxID=1265417 RepID=A0AAV8Y044_9CUCU|nr:hypothetical protein NQ318_011664 [Aromia moschata]
MLTSPTQKDKEFGIISRLNNDSCTSVPLIQSEVVVVNNQQSTDSISLRYTPTPQISSKFDMYRFSLSDPNIPDQEKNCK